MKKQLYFTKNQFMILDGREMVCHAGQTYEVENKQAKVLLDHKIALEVEDDTKSIDNSTSPIADDSGSKKLPSSRRKSRRLKN